MTKGTLANLLASGDHERLQSMGQAETAEVRRRPKPARALCPSVSPSPAVLPRATSARQPNGRPSLIARQAAKARATTFAKMLEERVEAELQVQQMWRQMMGNMPGVAAEIAKLHATEQAQMRLRQYEEEEARKKWRHGHEHEGDDMGVGGPSMADDMWAHFSSLTKPASTFSSAFKDEPLSPVKRRSTAPGMARQGSSAGVRVAPPPETAPPTKKSVAATPKSHDGAAPPNRGIPRPNKPPEGAPPVRDPNDRSAAEIAGPNHQLFDVTPTVIDPGLSTWSVAIDWISVNFGFREGDEAHRQASQHAPAAKGWAMVRHSERAGSAEVVRSSVRRKSGGAAGLRLSVV